MLFRSGATLRANDACVALAEGVGVQAELAALFGEAGKALLFEARATGHARARVSLAAGGRPAPTFRLAIDRTGSEECFTALLIDVSGEADLQRQLVERARVLGVLSDLATALSGSFELDQLARVLHEQTRRIMPAENFFISLFDKEANRISFPICVEAGQRLHPESRPFKNSVSEYVMRTAQPLVLDRNVMARVRALGIEPIGRPCESLIDRKSTRLNSSHIQKSRMPSSA